MGTMEIIGAWIAVALTLGLYSFLYKDNPVFKLCEHVFVGVGTGYMLVYTAVEIVWPKLLSPLWHLYQWELSKWIDARFGWTWNTPSEPLGEYESWWLLVPCFFCLCMLLRFIPKLVWLSRWSFSFIVGYAAGNSFYATVQGQLYPQAQGTLQPLWNPQGGWTQSVNTSLVLLGVLCVLVYFFFSVEHKGGSVALARLRYTFLGVGLLCAASAIYLARKYPLPEWDRARAAMVMACVLCIVVSVFVCREGKAGGVQAVSRLGIFFLMIAFGAAFGYTVMAREALLIGRVMELDRCARGQYGYATLILLPLIIGVIVVLETRQKPGGSTAPEA